MIKGSRSLAALALGLVLAAGTAKAENLDQAWAVALSVNDRLQSQQLESVAAGLNLAAAKAARLPTVRSTNLNIMLSTTPNIRSNLPLPAAGGGSAATPSNFTFPVFGPNQTDLPLSLTMASVPLYTGGKISRNIDAANAQVNVRRSEEFREALDLKLTVAESYVGVLRARKRLEVARSNVEHLASFARDVTNRREQGLAIRSDELAAGVSLANARLGEIRARTTVDSAWATYNRYLARPTGFTTELDELAVLPPEPNMNEVAALTLNASDSTIPDNGEVQALTIRALQLRPELAGLTEQARGLGAQAEATRAALRPQASVMGGFLFLGQSNFVPQGYGTLAFMLDWTITDSGATRRRTQALHEQERAALKRREDTAADIGLQIRTRWLDFLQARLSIPVARAAVTQADESLNVVQDRYRQQLSTYTEVLDAETRRVQSLNNFYDATYDADLSLFRLRRAVGDL